MIGEKGAVLLPHVEQPKLLPEKSFPGFIRLLIEDENHWHQFVEAVRGKGTTSTPFSYSGPLTESVLLGGIATHFKEQTLKWDAAKVAFKNVPDANRLIRRTYRPGWEVPGLS